MFNNKSKALVLGTLLIVIIIVLAGYFILHARNKAAPVPEVTINTKNQPTLGQPNAPVHLVVFEDLKCGNCKIFTNTIFPEIKKQYIDTGKAKYTLINLAFIPGSMPAGNAARCLYDQNKDFFFPYVDYVYANQPPEEEDWATVSKLLQFAQAATPKADLEKLSQCIVENRHYKVLQDNLKIAIDVMKGQVATPSLYINGKLVTPLTLVQIKKMMDEVN